MKEQSKQELVPVPPQCCCCKLSATILIESAHVIIKTACQFNTRHNKYKGEMTGVGVFDVDESVCEAHDINSVFNARNFTRFCKHPQNENNEERKGRRRVEEWLIAGHQIKWEPETVGCQNYYRFILYTCSPEICHTYTRSEQNKRGGRDEKVWAPCHRSNGARGLVKEA